MKQLLETIKIWNGVPQNIIYHNQRFNSTRRQFFPDSQAIDLYEHIHVPEEYRVGLIRCRLLYRAEIEALQFVEYIPKTINRLQLVESNLDYSYKWADRSELNDLLLQKGPADDVLIVKNGLITDSSYANIVFKNEQGIFTPHLPLLEGTKRHKLLAEGDIKSTAITPKNLSEYHQFSLINAFMDLDEAKFLPIKNILA